MARGATTDYAGLAGTELKLTGSDQGGTISQAEAPDERGDIIARDTFEELYNGTSDYSVCADFDVAAGIIMGTLIDGDTDPDRVLTGFNISTGAGTPPTVSASTEQVPTGSAEGYTYATPAQTLLAAHRAQILFGAFTYSGTGCHLISCSATGSVNLSRAVDEDAETCAWDVQNAKIEVTAEITKSAATALTFGAESGWTVTSPLTLVQVNSDYEKYSVTLTKSLTAIAPEE